VNRQVVREFVREPGQLVDRDSQLGKAIRCIVHDLEEVVVGTDQDGGRLQ
jgi:hypothetical protein